MIRVRAIEPGYDNLCLRQPGDEFDMPDDVFDERPRLDADGKPIPGQFYDQPHWFEPVDKALKTKLEREQEQRHARRLAGTLKVPAVNPAAQQHAADSEHARVAAEQAKSKTLGLPNK